MTIVYLIRHSKTLKTKNELNYENLQIKNEKTSLSLEGEQLAKDKLSKKEFNDIDVLYSSNYVRAVQTAKYIADEKIDLNLVSGFGERRFGIKTWEELPQDFEDKQFLDENYKIGDGESQKEVKERMYKSLINIITENKDKRIAIVSHATAISFLLKTWCDVFLDDNKIRFIFNNKEIFYGHLDYCETFKLEFDNDKLINIEIIN